jgi:hypothetical protein
MPDSAPELAVQRSFLEAFNRHDHARTRTEIVE